ncbi:MAG: hypothetical protein ABR915_23220 [Thermoguttaceae bacterium]|jgi:hypothetical protein
MSHDLSFLKAEIAKVQLELTVFRDEYLPVFLDLPPYDTPHSVAAQEIEDSNRLLPWYEAVTKLGEALPLPGTHIAALNAEDFKQFMFQEATPAFSISNGSIRWRIGLFSGMGWIYGFCQPPCMERKDSTEDQEREFLAKLPQIKTWLMGLPVTECLLFNSLCMVLPFIADVDPPFVKLALDLDTWRSIVSTNTAISELQRQKELDFIDKFYFGHVINNAMLHVFGALGNNHFMLIRDYLDHPCLYGGYTHLMPHYLFALLFQKVSILRQLATEQPPKAD